jgi:predicted Zn-dependent peptidase
MRSKLYISIIGVILLFLFIPISDAQKSYKELVYPKLSEIQIPKVERAKLSNGMILYLVEDHELPLIELTALIRTGSNYEPLDKVGLARITGSVMRTGGTKSKTGDEIDEILEKIAASVETGIGQSNGSAEMSVLKEDLDTGLQIFADVLMNPEFREDKIQLAKVQLRSGIARRNDDPHSIAAREFSKLIYGADSPYARTIEYETIDNITRDDLIAFHAKYFRPNNIILGAWGDFETAGMIKKIESAFQSWTPAAVEFPKVPEVNYGYGQSVNLVKKDDATQSNVLIGHIGSRLDDPDYFALALMSDILGGSFGSRLFNNIRSAQGLAYVVWGDYGADFDHPGIFSVGCQTKSETTIKAIEALIAEVKKIIQDEVTDEELSHAKDSFLNSYVFKFASKAAIMERMMRYEYYGYPSDFLQKFKANIEKVTKVDILRAAKSHLNPDKFVILAVGNENNFDRPLSELGNVNLIDIAIKEPKPKIAQTAPTAPDEASKANVKHLLVEVAEELGGLEKIKKIKDLHEKVEAIVITPQGDMNIQLTQFILFPDKFRGEISVPLGNIVQVFNKDSGWMITPQGSQDMPESAVKEAKALLFRNIFNLLANLDNFSIQEAGSEELNGKKLILILITEASGNWVKLAVDPSSHQILKKSYRGESFGGVADIDEIYEDYREISDSGLKLAHKTTINANGNKFMEMKLLEAKIDSGVDLKLFER